MKTNAVVKEVTRELNSKRHVRTTLPKGLMKNMGWSFEKPVFAKVEQNKVLFKQNRGSMKVDSVIMPNEKNNRAYQMSLCRMFPETNFDKATKVVFYSDHDAICMTTLE